MNTKNQTNLSQLVIVKYERFKKKKLSRDCMLTRTSYCTHIYNIHILKCYTTTRSRLGTFVF